MSRCALLLAAYSTGAGVAFVAGTLAIVATPDRSVALRHLGARLGRIAGAVTLLAGVLLLTGRASQLQQWLQHFTPHVGGL